MGVGAQRGAERALTRSVPTRSNLHTGRARTRGGEQGEGEGGKETEMFATALRRLGKVRDFARLFIPGFPHVLKSPCFPSYAGKGVRMGGGRKRDG